MACDPNTPTNETWLKSCHDQIEYTWHGFKDKESLMKYLRTIKCEDCYVLDFTKYFHVDMRNKDNPLGNPVGMLQKVIQKDRTQDKYDVELK